MSELVHLVQDGTESWATPLTACTGEPYYPPAYKQGKKVRLCEACNRLMSHQPPPAAAPVPDGERMRKAECVVDYAELRDELEDAVRELTAVNLGHFSSQYDRDAARTRRNEARAALDAYILPLLSQPAASEPGEIARIIRESGPIPVFHDRQPAAQQDALRTLCWDLLALQMVSPGTVKPGSHRYLFPADYAARVRAMARAALAATEETP